MHTLVCDRTSKQEILAHCQIQKLPLTKSETNWKGEGPMRTKSRKQHTFSTLEKEDIVRKICGFFALPWSRGNIYCKSCPSKSANYSFVSI